MTLLPASRVEHLEVARQLFREYADHIQIDLCFQDFERELANFPGAYGPPKGALLLAWEGDEAIGCVGFHPFRSDACEMKRLYVRPARQRTGVGRALAEWVIAEAKQLAYRSIVLDTLPTMVPAIALYKSLGFTRCHEYYDTPLKGTVFMELIL